LDKHYLDKLEELSNVVLYAKDINEAINKSGDLVKDIIDVDRVSIFIYENGMLWSLRADYTDKIEISENEGVVGFVAREKREYITNDAYNDEYFAKHVDMQTGYSTKNILAVPVIDGSGRFLGVVEFINKKGDFTQKDLAFAKAYSKFISEAIKKHLGIL